MVECSFIEAPNIYPNLNDQYVACFDYFDKSLIVLSATGGSISIASFATAIGTPVGIASTRVSLAFSLSTGVVKKIIKNNKK